MKMKSWPHLIAGIIVMAIGLWIFVTGLVSQWRGGDYTVIGWYLIGLALIAGGKMLKMQSMH